MGTPDDTSHERCPCDQERRTRKERINDSMARCSGRDQNEDGALALGVALPAKWENSRRNKPRTLQDLHEQFICITAAYLPDLCKSLRNYHLRVLQSLEAGDPMYHAVQSLWDDAGNFSDTESEDDEMEVV